MSEQNIVVSSTMTKAELLTVLRENFGEDAPEQNKAGILQRLAELGAVVDGEQKAAEPEEADGREPTHYDVLIHTSETDNSDVMLGFQGDTVLIKRGEHVKRLKAGFFHSLKNAVVRRYKDVEVDGGIEKQHYDAPSYPYQILAKHYD